MENAMIPEDEVLEKLGLAEYYILQKKEGYRFTIDPVLLAGFAETNKEEKILDLGTGGGILPFLLQKNNSDKNLQITGIDIQREYIEMAGRSRILNNSTNIEFYEMDIKDIPDHFKRNFDMVISNPPFFRAREGKVSLRRDIAIAKHELEIDFLGIIKAASKAMKDNGRFIFILRSERLMEAGTLLAQEGLCIQKLQLIYPDEKSSSKLFMAEAVKRKNPQLKVLAPLIIYDLKGNYMEEVKSLYE